MKESLFIKLVKNFYGISKPFDEFARDVINDAGNKIAIWLMVYLIVSAYALMVLISWFSPMNVVSGLIIADTFVYLIASAYIGRIIRKNKLDRYEFDNEEEQKIYSKRFIISRLFTSVLILLLTMYPISIWFRYMGMYESISPMFIGFFIGNLVVIYMQYCRLFKR
ncbi:DUF3278 domain-containing protein [Apilactobacillus kunkeei]|uniref:DUF3278 domain-containing protein n=1 Tax=Apilactobacillus kunkeei TaxID=148814 RepID=UPI00110CDD68|nr:DUF3278 domain-containing protein [Apilactobacillus kunkeei]TMT02126.1 DUF3278 domain-containing protein [Apilactobacillus kunkeei]